MRPAVLASTSNKVSPRAMDHVLPDFVHSSVVGGADVSDVGSLDVLVIPVVSDVGWVEGGGGGGVTLESLGTTGGGAGDEGMAPVLDGPGAIGGLPLAGVVGVTGAGTVEAGVVVVGAGAAEPPSPQLAIAEARPAMNQTDGAGKVTS